MINTTDETTRSIASRSIQKVHSQCSRVHSLLRCSLLPQIPPAVAGLGDLSAWFPGMMEWRSQETATHVSFGGARKPSHRAHVALNSVRQGLKDLLRHGATPHHSGLERSVTRAPARTLRQQRNSANRHLIIYFLPITNHANRLCSFVQNY